MIRLLTIFLFLPLFSFSQTWQWTKKGDTFSQNSEGSRHSICTDGMGNCYAVVDSMRHAKILKYNSFGNLIWKVSLWDGLASAIVSDNSGHLYVAGGSLAGGILAKYDTSGALIWKVNGGSDNCNGISLDNNLGFIYLTGSTTFLEKFNTSGNQIWSRNSNMYVTGNSVCTDNLGYCYITGQFFDTAFFGTNLLTSSGAGDIFITKYDASGNCLWAKRAGGKADNGATITQGDRGYAITTDNIGNIYFTGTIMDTANFDSFTLITKTDYANDCFLAKYDTNGNVLWVKQAENDSDHEGRCIAIDNQNNILIGGSFVPTTKFDGVPLGGWGNYDAFVAKYDNNGNFINALSAGGSFWNDYVFGICSDNLGNTFVTGSFNSYNTNTYFGSDILIGTGGHYAFVSKIDLTTGIEEIKNNSFNVKIYPNPVTDQVNIQLDDIRHETLLIEIKNVLGQIVKNVANNETPEKQTIEIDVKDLPNGIYFLTLESVQQRAFAKFIKN
ncbi:MAG: T9SS type A sorting domain-containing protein [Bacteroidetes bacterium]|nr:T9SS type A sorting domain-containing protein [Bacteroidota bacterium]